MGVGVGVVRIGIQKKTEWLMCGAEFKRKTLTGVNGRLCRVREKGFAKMKFQIHFKDIARSRVWGLEGCP